MYPIASSDHVFKFSLYIFAILSTLYNNFFFDEHDIFWNFMHIFFVNSIRFATCLNKIFCNRRKTDGETQKSKRKCFLQQKRFWSEPKTFASFSGVPFVEKHEGNKRRYTKNLIKNFKFLFCFSRFAWA